MSDIMIRTTSGGHAGITGAALRRFSEGLDGEVITDSAPSYGDACRVWNGMVDRKPKLFVRCRSAADVRHAVRFARDNSLLVSVRGGGHNIAGNALVDGGMVIDLAKMRGVEVDPDRRRARVEPGALLSDVDGATQTYGLATPLGINSTTGIAGLTLGGGFGWLSRRFGLTIDNLRSVTMITADGESVTAGERENAELFWAVRGGGGNFGVVTSFEFRLHAVGPEITAGLIVHPFANAPKLLRGYREVVEAAPDELSVWVVMRKAPPLPFLAPEVHGREILVFAVCYTGAPAEAERVLQPLRALGTPHADVVGPATYAAFQQAFDPLLGPGARNYWKSHNFSVLGDELIDTLVARVHQLPGPECEIFLGNLGGAVSRVPDDATAYTGRDAQFAMNVHGRWSDEEQDAQGIAWTRDVFASTARFASAGAYVNFLTADEGDRVRTAYGQNYERLAMIKARVDPMNMFRFNQNIAPASSIAAAAALRSGRPAEEARPTA